MPKNPVKPSLGPRASLANCVKLGPEVDDILPTLRNHLFAHAFNDIEICRDYQVGFAATRQDADNICVKRVLKSFEKVLANPRNYCSSLQASCEITDFKIPWVW